MTDEYEPGEDAPKDEGTPKWQYNALIDWMEGWFLPLCWRYDKTHRRWCEKWWDHPWAVERLSALWQAWEVMYSDPGQMSSWWIYHFDSHWARLTGDDGPFKECSYADHIAEANEPLPHERPPEAWLMPTRGTR